MTKQRRLTVLSAAMLLALLVSAALPFAALADDGAPPADAPVVDEVAPPTVEEPPTIPEILDQLPEDTALVVVDQNGEALPLASADAAEALIAPDPYFTVGGIRYEFTAADCDPDTAGDQVCSNPIQAAFDYLTDNDLTPDFGLITVEAGTYTEDVTVDGRLWENQPLSLKLIGEDGSDNTILNGSFDLSYFSGDFELTGFTIKDYVSLEAGGNVDVSDLFMDVDGLYVGSGGAATLGDVTVRNNDGYGAEVYADGDVTITGGDFSDNGSSGIFIESYYGNAFLTDVQATGNGNGEVIGNGAKVYADGNVTISGGNFSDNEINGIYSYSYGDTVLMDVNATGNYVNGASVFADGNVNVSGGDFSHNLFDGIYIYSYYGDAVLTDVNATGNYYGNGASVFADGNVTVSGGDFSENGIWGVEAYSIEGNVTLNDASAFGNGFGNFSNRKLAIENNSTYYETGGAFVTSEFGSIKIVCGNYSGNNGAGLQFYSIGNTNLDGPILEGNTHGYNWLPSESGEGTLSFGKCRVVMEEDEREFKPQNSLSQAPTCNGEKKVVLQAGDAYGIYENLCDVEFQLQEVNEDELPGKMPSVVTQLVSLEVKIISGGTEQSELPVGGKITLKFPIPEGTDEASLTVLFWNGSVWEEVPGGNVMDGFYVVDAAKPGNYVLAAK